MTIAWVFPGQGSQKLGMARDVIDLPGALERFQLASNLIGRDLFKICNEVDSEVSQPNDLNDTRNTQPAMFVVESLLVDELKRQGQKPALTAGHSLGEIVALYAADVFTVETALSLLKIRSELMADAKDGSMTAIMGFDRQELDDLLRGFPEVVIANDNSSSQIVLSGAPKAINGLIQELNCKRAIPLNVSGAFHSPFMLGPAQEFERELDKVEFSQPSFPVVSNSEPTPTIDILLLKDRLKNQMTTGVRWRETMELFARKGIKNFVEIGPGNVLSGLAKRSLNGININRFSTTSDLIG